MAKSNIFQLIIGNIKGIVAEDNEESLLDYVIEQAKYQADIWEIDPGIKSKHVIWTAITWAAKKGIIPVFTALMLLTSCNNVEYATKPRLVLIQVCPERTTVEHSSNPSRVKRQTMLNKARHLPDSCSEAILYWDKGEQQDTIFHRKPL